MITYQEIPDLNFNEYAFFKGIPTTDAKWEFAHIIFPKDWLKKDNYDKYFTKSGNPKISVNDRVSKDKFDFTMTSNSALDGTCQMKYLCEYYNKGVTIQKLSEFSQDSALNKAMRFSGKKSIVELILNSDQLNKLKKTWLFNGCYSSRQFTDNIVKFIMSNDWAKEFLVSKGIPAEKIDSQIVKFKERKNTKK